LDENRFLKNSEKKFSPDLSLILQMETQEIIDSWLNVGPGSFVLMFLLDPNNVRLGIFLNFLFDEIKREGADLKEIDVLIVDFFQFQSFVNCHILILNFD
jgi:hypothetical protein